MPTFYILKYYKRKVINMTYIIENLTKSYWNKKKPFRLIKYDKYGREFIIGTYKTLENAKKKKDILNKRLS